MSSKFTGFVQPVRLGSVGPTQFTAYGQQRHSLIYSENHRKQTRGDNGGPFMVEHVTKDVQPTSQYARSTFNGVEQNNVRFVANSPSPGLLPSFPKVGSFSTEQAALRSSGATGWKRARPGNPVVEAGQWLAELRSLPTLPLRMFQRLGFFRGLGSEYLNVQFGWKPFVGDLIKMHQLYHELDRRLAQLVRDNGKGIRRRATVLENTDTSSTVTNYPTGLNAFWPSAGGPVGYTSRSTLQVQTCTYEKIWFVARFRYYVPDIGSSQWTRRATRALYGVNPTPSLLWEVLPWSWLIDYFSNVGDVVSNLSSNAVDNLVADYAYVMRTKRVTTTYTALGASFWEPPKGTFWKVDTSEAYAATTSTMVETKSRARATPYGFGVKLGDLSNYQLSILGALGLSRQRFL